MRTALVTGGTRGIGKAIVEKLRSQGIVVHSWGHEVDVRLKSKVQEAVEKIGPLDILINNAGIFGPVGSALTYDVRAWADVIETNLTGQLIVAQAVIPGMVSRGYGRVVNLSSVVAKDTNPLCPAYTVSKAGIVALTRCLGLELAKTGVTVNCVMPAAVNTDLFKDTPPSQVEMMLKKCPMQRFVTVTEVANLVAWLASDECSATTGAAFDIAGGRCQF
jgi:3-oxoacyl-[acyl-carrier protein] reductase